MNPVNDFPNDKPWHPLDFQFFSFEGGGNNEGLKKMVLKMILFILFSFTCSNRESNYLQAQYF